MKVNIEKTLEDFVAANLTTSPDNTRKIACLVWFDKLSGRTAKTLEHTGIRLLVHTTPCHVPYDPNTVINTLVNVFGYGAQRAYRRVVAGVQSRANQKEAGK